jgi:hypothetical protein
VTAAAVLVFVQAALAALATLLVLVIVVFVGLLAAGSYAGSSGGVILIIAIVAGLIGIGIVVLFVWLGIKLLRLRNWARITTIILNGLGVLSYIAGIGLAASARRGPGGTAVQGSLAFVLEVAVIVLLLTPSANRAFAAARR